MAGGTRRRQALKKFESKPFVDNFDNYTNVDYQTAISYWVGK